MSALNIRTLIRHTAFNLPVHSRPEFVRTSVGWLSPAPAPPHAPSVPVAHRNDPTSMEKSSCNELMQSIIISDPFVKIVQLEAAEKVSFIFVASRSGPPPTSDALGQGATRQPPDARMSGSHSLRRGLSLMRTPGGGS